MTSAAIIEEIRQLSPADQTEVIRFAVALARERALTPEELNRLAQRMVESEDPGEVEKLKASIASGFYGKAAHA
jgi:hypothetical protein